MRPFKSIVFITLPLLLLLFVLMEFTLRKWFPVQDPYERFKNAVDKSFIPSQMPPNVRYTFKSKEGLPGMDSVMNYSTNNVGFRGDSLAIPKPDNEFRIVLIGGSTTQCLYVDDSKSIDRILQNELCKNIKDKMVKVYNAGKSGEATPEHLAILTQKVIHLQPDLIIVFSGINDFRRSVRNYDFKHLTQRKLYTPRYIYLAATELQVIRRLYYLFNIRTADEIMESLPFETNNKELFKIQQQTPVSDSIPKTNAGSYAINLGSIAGICKENQVKLIFMTNQSTWNSTIDSRSAQSHYMLTVDRVRYKEEYLDKGLEVFNDTMRGRAQRMNVPLMDLAREMPKTQDYFYDDCHFNVNGASFAAKKLANLIIVDSLLY